ncbi:CerR family C-terminal domain-containing protein [Shewanella oncorhynchi]|nr:CerR family C-terminal domain-containing protein [Shewanella oncorhynchi]
MSSIMRNSKLRYVAGAGYARGEDTRARIINAALKIFGELGFDGASTRGIAAAAGVNAPALQYYFNNKEGVYLACAEYIASRVWEHMAPVVDYGERMLTENAGDDELIDAFCAIQVRTAEFMFESRESPEWRLFIAREQGGLEPAAGFQIMYQIVNKPISNLTVEIVGRLLGRPADDEETRIRSIVLNGQLALFQMMRRTAMASLDWEDIDAKRLDLIKRVITEHSRILLRSMVAERTSA